MTFLSLLMHGNKVAMSITKFCAQMRKEWHTHGEELPELWQLHPVQLVWHLWLIISVP
jgi:hypothetical protein